MDIMKLTILHNIAGSVSSEFNGRSGGSPSEEGGSSVEWPAASDKPTVDTQPLIPTNLDQGLPSSGVVNNQV